MTASGRNRLKIWLVIVGVFVLGCLTGASLDSAYRLRAGGAEHGRRNKEDIFESLRRDLNLDERQAAEVRSILEQTRNDYRALRAEAQPRYDAIRQHARTRIRALLTPDQQKSFDARVAERDRRRSREKRDDRDDR